MGNILLARKEAQQRATLAGVKIDDRAAQRRVALFERCDNCTLGDGAGHFKHHFRICLRQSLEVERKYNFYHR